MAAGTLASLWTKRLKLSPGQAQPRGAEGGDAPAKACGETGGKPISLLSPNRSPARSPSRPCAEGEGGAGQAKKRKRERLSAAQLGALLDRFERNAQPGREETQAIARDVGLEVPQVQAWFKQQRRKKARLGREQRQPAAGPGPAPQPPVVLLDDEDEVEAGAAAGAEAEAEAEAPRDAAATPAAQPAAAADSQSPRSAEPAAEQGPAAMDAEPAEAPPASLSQPASATASSPQPRAASKQPRSQPGGDSLAAAEPDGSQWTGQWMRQRLAELQQEAGDLAAHVQGLQPLQPLPAQPLASVNRAQVASLLAGCTLPIGQLLERLCGEGADREALRSCVLDMATRKSFAAREGKGERDDALTSEEPALLWRWELRALQPLPKALQPRAKQLKKALQEASARLTALKAAEAALADAAAKGRATSKAEKALARLAKLPAPGAAAGSAAPASGEAAAAPPTQPSPVKSPSKSPARPPSQAAREAAGQEQEAEKERQKQEKEAEKERQKQEKERAREQQRAERQQAKQERKLNAGLAGFGSTKTIEKSRTAFTSFFRKTPGPGFSRSALKAQRATPAAGGGGGGGSPLVGRALDAAFTPEGAAADRAPGTDAALQATIERELRRARSPEEAESGARQLLRRWKQLPRHRRVRGRPPTWARRAARRGPALPQPDLAAEDTEELRCCTWRRKFLWFPAELGTDGLGLPQPHWPPYYGSWSRASAVVGPRRPLARDPGLDYEVMEDEEWEPEPEGDSLSNDEGEEEEGLCGEESGCDGFFVPDGQLSADEGLSSAQQELDTLCAETEDDAAGGAPAAPDAAASAAAAALAAKQRLLEAAMRKAAPRPLLVSRLLPAGPDGCPGCLHGDAALLAAFAAQVVVPGARASLPPPPEAGTPGKAGGTPRPERQAGGGGGGSLERPEELVPQLLAFLLSHPELKAVPKVVQAFCDAHAGRKLVKKWVADKVRALAERHPGGWRLRPEAAAQAGHAPPPSPRPPIALLLSPRKAAAPAPAAVGAPEAPEASGAAQAAERRAGPGRVLALGGQEVESAADPRWQALVSHLVGGGDGSHGGGGDPFAVITDARTPQAVPHSVLGALLKTLGSGGAPSRLREACARGLAQLATLLAAGAHDGPLSPPHKVWGDARSAPAPASLAALLRDPALPGLLLRCLNGAGTELCKATGLLLGALVRVGCPTRLTGRPAEPVAALSEAGEAAAGFRAALAGGREWAELLAAGCSSPTLRSYKLLALAYLLQDPRAGGALLGQGGSYTQLLHALLAGCREPHTGCAKYGALGLAYLLRWHAGAAGRPLAAEAQASVAAQLAAMLRGMPAAGDESSVLLEAAACLGEAARRGGGRAPPGADAADALEQLRGVLGRLAERPEGGGPEAFEAARQALS